MTSISRSGGVLAILDGSLEFKETRLSSESMNGCGSDGSNCHRYAALPCL